MSTRLVCPKFVLSLFFCLALAFAYISPVWAQSASTGALTGVVTDPSGAVIGGATVTLTNIGTGQTRTATTNTNGNYTFSLIPPGTYSIKFEAPGFKTSTVPSVTVNVTETPALNEKLEIGAQTAQITVVAPAETVQTQNATVGNLVGSQTVTNLPLSSRNYTQIIDLSPGVVVNVASAAAVGNGTQDINVNGNGSDQNNYTEDGATLTNYGSGGGAQSGNFPGIGIPNPDAIEQFKIQTSQYDAQYGRNPGASVNVVTKTGTNQFHGAAWEFFRNSALDANDIFNRISQNNLHAAGIGPENKPEALNENLFGGTLGGPIKKDKLFFFGSYQGFRQLNAVGTNGFASGLSTGLTLYPFTAPGPNGGRGNNVNGTIPLDYVAGNTPCSYTSYRSYLGCAFGGLTSGIPIFGTQVPVATNGSNINQVAINVLQHPGPNGSVNQGFYVPGAPFTTAGLPATSPSGFAVAQPTRANENQYLGNLDYVVDSRNTLSQKVFYSKDPQTQSFVCLDNLGTLINSCAPGSPENVNYSALNETVKLTTVATGNFVNEVLFAYIREAQNAVPGNYFTACSLGITPPVGDFSGCSSLNNAKNINRIITQAPTISILGLPLSGPVGYGAGALNTGGNFFASGVNTFNTFEGKDNISWVHGKHTIRAGFEVDRLQYNVASLSRGGLDFPTVADFLTSSSGAPATGTAPAGNGILVNFFGLPSPIGNPLGLRSNEFAAYTEDDIRVTSRLTLNLGVRWEYDGYPTDVQGGIYANAFASQAALVNTGSFFLGNEVSAGPGTPSNQIGTLAGSVVPSNYNSNFPRCGNPVALSGCGFTAPAGIFPGYPGGATGVFTNTNKTLVHGAPYNDFGPRIGLAWQATNKLVVRAGYGIFYDAVYANLLADNQEGNPPYNGFANTAFPGNSLDTPIAATATGGILGWQPRTLQVLAGSPTTGATLVQDNSGGAGLGTTSDSEALGVPRIQQYNLDLQYEVAKNWVIDVGYVGSHGTHLYDFARTVNIAFLAPNAPNEPAANDLQDRRMIIGSGAQGTPNSFAFNDAGNTNPSTQILENTGNSANFLGNTLGRTSFLGYSPTGFSTTSTQGDSVYNSLQAQLRHQFSHGLLIQASYTWSKLFTNVNSSEAGGGIAAPGNVLSGSASSNDPLDLGQQYGLAAFNRPQRFILAYSYDLPYKHTQGFTGHAFGGWTVSGVTTIQDGEPFTVIDGNAGTIYYAGAAGFGGSGIRAELNPANTGTCNSFGVCQGIGLSTTGSTEFRALHGFINPAAFTSAPCIGGTVQGNCAGSGGGTGFGNSAIGSIAGPGQHNWDISLIKNTKITEALNLQFRVEGYNVFNHAQFNPPVNDRSQSTFGQIQNSSVPPRIMQFAFKFLF